MKLTYFQLEPHLLKKKLASVYLISGDEILLKQEAISFIRKSAEHAGFTERLSLFPEKGFAWDTLFSHFYATSLLSNKRLIELHLEGSLPNKAGDAILQAYCQTQDSNTLLLISLGKADAKITKSAWFQAAEKAGVLISIWPIPREQLPQWLIKRARELQLSLSLAAATFLAEYVEGNLVAATQALEKLHLLATDKPIDEKMLRSLFIEDTRFTLFDFIETLTAGKSARALRILETLRMEGTELPLLLWVITRELRLLAEYANKVAQGMSYDTLFQKYRIFFQRQNGIRYFLKKFTQEDCHRLLSEAAEIDRSIKGANQFDPWQRLQIFCLRMAK